MSAPAMNGAAAHALAKIAAATAHAISPIARCIESSALFSNRRLPVRRSLINFNVVFLG
jgi:hypothetical protein